MHGLSNKLSYLARTIPDIGLFKPLEEVIRHQFLQSTTGQHTFTDVARELMVLPTRLGGLGIVNPSRQTMSHYSACKMTTAPLVTLILQQS